MKLNQYFSDADKCDPNAMLSIGVLYQEGWGVTKDYSEALRWHHLAAKNGEPKAMHNIGIMHQIGLGVERDNFEAVKWYQDGDTNLISYSVAVRSPKNSHVVISKNIEFKQRYIKNQEYKNLRSIFSAIQKKDREQLVFKKGI